MDTFLPREIYLIIGILIFAFLIFLLFFTDKSKKEGEKNQKELKKPNNVLGKENSVNLNLAITYSEMNQIDKAKEIGKDDINQHGIYMKFICIEKEIILPKGKPV